MLNKHRTPDEENYSSAAAPATEDAPLFVAPKKRFLELREQPSAKRSMVLGALGVLAFFAVWEVGHYLTAESARKFFPSVEQVGAALYKLFAEQNFLLDVAVSCRRILLSFLAAAAVGIPIGILMGCFGNKPKRVPVSIHRSSPDWPKTASPRNTALTNGSAGLRLSEPERLRASRPNILKSKGCFT